MWKMLLLLVLSLYSPAHAALRGRLQAEPAEGQSELGTIITNLLSDSEVLLESMAANTHEISLDDQLTPATPTTTAMTQESDDETATEPTVNENEILDDGAPLSDDGYDEEPSRPSERKKEESPDEDEDESKHAAEDDGENVASAVDIAYIEHIARKTGEDKRHDVLTDIYLTNKLRCPIGYERAGAHAPKASHPAYEGDLHEGVRPPLPAEKTEHGCTCARAWIFRPHKSETKPNTQYSGERILSTGCLRREGERPWCPVDLESCTRKVGNTKLMQNQLPSRWSKIRKPASKAFDLLTVKKYRKQAPRHHCKDLLAYKSDDAIRDPTLLFHSEICFLPLESTGSRSESAAPVFYSEAQARCTEMRARLPTLLEVRSLGDARKDTLSNPSEGDANDELLLWTMTPCFTDPEVTMNINSGPGMVAVRVNLEVGKDRDRKPTSTASGFRDSIELSDRCLHHRANAFHARTEFTPEKAATVCVTEQGTLVRPPKTRRTSNVLLDVKEAWASSSVACKEMYSGEQTDLCSFAGDPGYRGGGRKAAVCPHEDGNVANHEQGTVNCEAIGARLPTLSEMNHESLAFRTDEEREDITQRATNAGAGAVDCQYKDHYSWTSTPCFLDGDGDMPTGFMTTVATLRARLNRGRPPACKHRDSLMMVACVALETAPIRWLHKAPADGVSTFRNGWIHPIPFHWDYCEDEPQFLKPAEKQPTIGNCECLDTWFDHKGNTQHGCALGEAPPGMWAYTARLQGSKQLAYCQIDATSCWDTSRNDREISVFKRFSPVKTTPDMERPGGGAPIEIDICLDPKENPMTYESIRRFICLKRETPTHHDHKRETQNFANIVDLFIAHNVSGCPPDSELVHRDPELSGSITEGAGGLTMMLCVKRAGGSSENLKRAALDDILVSGGNLSVLSCPCGYNTVDHSPVSKKDQYDHVELPINLMQMPFDSVSSTEGAPWYTFFCTHRVVDGITRKEIALTESARISAKNERIAHLDAMPEHSDDTIIVFLFLVYHSLDNEELWKRFFRAAPAKLHDSWRIVIHHKNTLTECVGPKCTAHSNTDDAYLHQGPWMTEMIAAGKIVIVPKNRLVTTKYCDHSLPDAALVMIEVALEQDYAARVGELVLISGDSIPIRSFASTHRTLLREEAMCLDAEEEPSNWIIRSFTKAAKLLQVKLTAGGVIPEKNVDAVKTFLKHITARGFKPIKTSQWETYSRADAVFLVEHGRAILNLMSWKSISVGAYACPDEVILSTLLVYGRGFSSGDELTRVDRTGKEGFDNICRMQIEWGDGHAGHMRILPGTSRLGMIDSEDGVPEGGRCESETVLENRNLYFAGRDPGFWWQTIQSPLVFKTIPRGLISWIRTHSPHAEGKLFLRKVTKNIFIDEVDIAWMYGEDSDGEREEDTHDDGGSPRSVLRRVTVAEGIPFTPEVFSTKDSSWHPICGHRFWDNDKGATTACVEFGFNSGVVVRTEAIYDSDAVLVGMCNDGEALDSCFIDPDWPTIHLSGTSLSCTAGNAVGVDITCFNQR